METAIEPGNYRFLQERVHAESGIVLGEDKQYLFESRLSPIVRDFGLSSINDLCALLHATGETTAMRQVVEAMTTNETYFFRDPAQYELIRTVLLPRLKAERADQRKLSFWSAAASTGQEAYSLAMLLRDEGFDSWNIQILGTDLSSQTIARARDGVYRQIEVNRGLPAARLIRYFTRNDMDWKLSAAIRAIVHFEVTDLRASMRTLGPFDLVFCRNVLIYFDDDTRRKILREVYGTLFRGGWLLLGGAENAMGAEACFERQVINNIAVYVAR